MKCADFFIIKLRYFADDRVLKAFYNTPGHESLPLPKQHYERADKYIKFFWDFVEKVTGKNSGFWYKEYMFMTRECVEDEIKESHGIIILGGEGWATFLIPIRHTDLIEWVKNNATIPIKIVKRINMFFINHWHLDVDQERRKESKRDSIEFCKKHNIIL